MPDPYITPGYGPGGYNPGEIIAHAGIRSRMRVGPSVNFTLTAQPAISFRLQVGT